MELKCNNGHVVACNGQVIIFHVLHRNNNPAVKSVLVFSRKTFDAETGQFIEISGGEYNVPSSKSTMELARVSCVADARSGIRLPCILLRTCKRKSSGSRRILLLLHSSNELEPYLKFKVDSETIEDLYIADGPTVLWRQHEKLLYVSSLTSEVLTAPINISAVLWAGTIEEGTCILGITTVRLDGKHLASSLPNRSLQGTEFILYCIDSQKAVPGSCLVPHAYSSVLRCLEVCMMQNVNGRYETSAIAASRKQLIWFHNGVPKQVCQLPNENLSKIQVAYTSRADLLCVLSFSSGDACAIWKDGWKTAASWQQVGNTLVDDFVGSGSDQVLLLFNDDPSSSSEHQAFRLTNCGDINYPADHIDENVVEFPENHSLMLQTLEARLQANLLSLEELQRHMQVQDQVLESSCRALADMSLGVETSIRPAEKEGLVSLFDDVENCTDVPAAKTSTPGDAEQLVEAMWHCVVDDLLVVGVKLKSSVSETLSDIGLSLIMDQEGALPSPVTKCQTNVLKLAISSSRDSSICHAEPTAKKRRLDYHGKDNISGNSSHRPCPPSYQNDLERTVTAVTELSSLLALNNTACLVLLHARRKTQPDCLLRSEKLIVPCGSVSLSLEDVLKGKHTINVFEHCQGSWSLEDIFAILSAFQKCSLHILSLDCTLTSVTEWMRAHMHGEPLKHMPEIMMCKKDGSLHGTLFTWNPKTPCEGNLTVFYRNNSVLLQCLHSLKCVLPPTCVVKLMRGSDRNSMAVNLAQSLEEELFALRNLVSSTASEVEKTLSFSSKAGKKVTSTSDCISDTKEQILKYREDLRAEQTQIRMGTHLCASSETYRHNVLSIAQVQMNSDALAGNVANI